MNGIQTSELSSCDCTGSVTGNGATSGLSPAFLPVLCTCGGGGRAAGMDLGLS